MVWYGISKFTKHLCKNQLFVFKFINNMLLQYANLIIHVFKNIPRNASQTGIQLSSCFFSTQTLASYNTKNDNIPCAYATFMFQRKKSSSFFKIFKCCSFEKIRRNVVTYCNISLTYCTLTLKPVHLGTKMKPTSDSECAVGFRRDKN